MGKFKTHLPSIRETESETEKEELLKRLSNSKAIKMMRDWVERKGKKKKRHIFGHRDGNAYGDNGA